jgi:hypothetical protein
MSASEETERDQRVLKALMFLLFHLDQAEDVAPLPDPDGPEPVLSPEYQEALDALGPDLVQRLSRQLKRSRANRRRNAHGTARRNEPTLTGSMHRGGKESKLTDEARAEMERKIRELEEQEQEDSEP